MQTASGLPIRKTIRLPGYDYSGDATYFVTVCAFQHQCLFGDCLDGTVKLGDIGNIVEEEWRRTAFRGDVTLGEYQVMPNHLHGLLFLANKEINDNEPLRRELFRIIGGFKSAVTSRVRKHTRQDDFEVWQKRFHDHVVRNPRALQRIETYIRENPSRWQEDPYHPANQKR